MIRYRALFEDLTGLRNGAGEHERDRVAEIRDRSTENSEVTTGNRDLVEGDSDLAVQNGDRTADTPR
jgi:hypothetical protein